MTICWQRGNSILRLIFSLVYSVMEPRVIVFLVPQVLQREGSTTTKSRSDKARAEGTFCISYVLAATEGKVR